MKFNRYETYYDNVATAAQCKDSDEFYAFASTVDNKGIAARAMAEWRYYRGGRPYYNVYPCILEMCSRIAADTPIPQLSFSGIETPKGAKGVAISIRFPEGNELESMLINTMMTEQGQVVGIHSFLKPTEAGDMRDIAMIIKPETTLNIVNEFPSLATELRVIACLGLLADADLRFLERDICSKDRDKPLTEAVLRRATARKGLGWNLGRELESIPHTRRPHFSVRWCEKGRKVPRLRPIKSSIVNRKTLEKMPSGFES